MSHFGFCSRIKFFMVLETYIQETKQWEIKFLENESNCGKPNNFDNSFLCIIFLRIKWKLFYYGNGMNNTTFVENNTMSIHMMKNLLCLNKKICCSVAQLCPTLCDPMDCSTLGFPVLHHLPELAQTYVHWVSDAILPTISFSVVPFSCLQSFQIRVFSNKLAL